MTPQSGSMAPWCINSEKTIGKHDFPYHFKKIIVRYKKIGYNIDVLRQTTCLVVNPVKVNNFRCDGSGLVNASVLVPHSCSFIYLFVVC